jgi:hypothetical protein
MATITSTAAGNWSAGGTWVGGVAPVDGDKAVINHVVTVDDTSRAVGVNGATDSILINASGSLKASRTANSTLTVKGRIKLNADGATLDYGKSTDKIPSTYTARMILNRDDTAGGHLSIDTNGRASMGFYIHGDTNRTRVTKLTTAITSTGSVSFDVADATGWTVGDDICLGHSNSANPSTTQYEECAITAKSGNTITATVAYTHGVGCFVGNMTANVSIESYNGANPAGIDIHLEGLSAQTVEFGHAVFLNMGSYAPIQAGLRIIDGYAGATSAIKTFDGMVFRATTNDATYNSPNSLCFNAVNRKFTISNSISYTRRTITQSFCIWTVGDVSKVDFDNCMLCAETPFNAVNPSIQASKIRNSWISVSGQYPISPYFNSGIEFENTVVSGWGIGFSVVTLPYEVVFSDSDIGSTHGWYSRFGDKFIRNGGSYGAYWRYRSRNTKFAAAWDTPMTDAERALCNDICYAEYLDKNGSVTTQEIYTAYGTIKRDNSNNKRSTSSVAIKPTAAAKDIKYEVSIPCANGATVRVVGYCKADSSFYNGGGSGWTAPTAVLSGTINGVTLTPATFTASSAANNAFEFFDISITNSSGADGNVTLTLNANAKSVTTGTVYFDGVPTNSKFVTKARHYGFVFDQTLPNATVNSAVSGSSAWSTAGTGSASLTAETTALGITGVTIPSPSSSASAIVLTASKTFQQVYDYTQAWACTTTNLAYAVPCTSPVPTVLIAAANVTTTGYSLTGGSIAMGSYTLTSQLTAGGYAFTYTGGTYSQAVAGSAVFNGGTLTLGAENSALTFTASNAIITFAPTANAVTYGLGGGTFSGTIDLRNTHATRTITVELPSGTTYTTANNTGAAITVTTPAIYQSVTITGFTAGSRIWIKDVTSGTVLFNGTASAGGTVISGSSCVWTDAVAASASRQIKIRVAYQSGATAKEFVEVLNIGTCGVLNADKAITYIVTQTADATYDANAVDGSTVTDITFTDAATDLVVCNLSGGSTTYARLYAAFVAWMFTSAGIDDDNTYIEARDTANYLFTAMKIRNTNATPLTITGGYGRDATSGLVADIIDVAGSTGNIYPQPDHVVPYQTTGTYAITGDISTIITSIGNIPDAVWSKELPL